MKPLIQPKLLEKDAKQIFKEFFDAKTPRDKQKIWDKLVPYANAYPKLYREMTSAKIKERRPNVETQETVDMSKMRGKNVVHSTRVNKGQQNKNMSRVSRTRGN